MKQRLFLSILCVVFTATSAWAAELPLVVQDTSGVVRGTSFVEEIGNVTFEVAQDGMPSNGAEITLTNAETGMSLSGVSVNGTVAFEGVPAGTWTVASLTPNVTFTSVSVIPAIAAAGPLGIGLVGGSAVAAGVGGAAALGAATLAIVEAQDDDNNEKNRPLSPFR